MMPHYPSKWAPWELTQFSQLPSAAPSYFSECHRPSESSSLTQNLMQIRCSVYSVTLNSMATQYTCSLNGVYRPHWLIQQSHHCSHMHIPVHSSWLPGFINVTQTVLVILTMAGLFLDRLVQTEVELLDHIPLSFPWNKGSVTFLVLMLDNMHRVLPANEAPLRLQCAEFLLEFEHTLPAWLAFRLQPFWRQN